jgi:hypothetical protein
MQEKTYTLNIRQAGKFQYEVTVPEIGATKMAPTLDSALNITLHDILKHLTTRFLILVFVDQQIDSNDPSSHPPEDTKADLGYQAAFEVAQQGIASQMKRNERHLVFELSGPLTREQAVWLDEQVGKLFDGYYIKDELEVEPDALHEVEAHE